MAFISPKTSKESLGAALDGAEHHHENLLLTTRKWINHDKSQMMIIFVDFSSPLKEFVCLLSIFTPEPQAL